MTLAQAQASAAASECEVPEVAPRLNSLEAPENVSQPRRLRSELGEIDAPRSEA